MAPSQDELEALRQQVAALTTRIFRLEQRLGAAAEAPRPEAAQTAPAAPSPPIPQAPPTQVTSPPPRTSAAAPPSFAAATAAPATSGTGGSNLESKIGKVWLNYIGIFAILIGVSFFLKYAFDSDMIGHAGRVAIGIVAGILVVLWSERFRSKGQAVFSYSLKAVGIGILYLSLWGARQFDPPLISVEAAFLLMIVVTAATVTLAVTQNAEILALYALIGGFLSPVLVSTGKNAEVALFTYVAILDLGMLVLAALKPWRRLLWVNFVATVILYVGWYTHSDFYTKDERAITVFFASLFAAIFAAIPLVTPYRKSSKFPGPSITLTLLPLLNAVLFFLALYDMYSDEKVKLTWYALGLAAVYLGISNVFTRRFAEKDTRKVISLLHIAIAIAFITIAVPLKLDAHWITIGWLIESAVLLWIADRTTTKFLQYLGTAALVLGIFRVLFFDISLWSSRLIFNARFATYMVAIAVLGGIIVFATRGTGGTASNTDRWAIRLAGVVLNVLVLIALTLEAKDYFMRQSAALETYGRNWEIYARIEIVKNFSYSVIWLLYGVALMVMGFWKRSAFVRWQALALVAVTIVKIFTYDSSELDKGYRILSFIALGVVLLGISYVYQRDWLKLSPKSSGKSAQGTSA